MILRRLVDGVREQNWFLVVLEVLIVVVGIFIGLQVNDWSDERIDRADEQAFLFALHGDLLLSDDLSRRLRERRLLKLDTLMDASDVLFGRSDRNEFSQEECMALGGSHFYNFIVSDLSSMSELISAGRMHIIRNQDLRSALFDLQQKKAALNTLVNLQASVSNNLSTSHADLIQLTAYFDQELNEAQSEYTCDIDGMRSNQLFMNRAAENVDIYDAFVRDGLAPWSAQFDKVHALVDAETGITHQPAGDF
jgi:hypothetical protein